MNYLLRYGNNPPVSNGFLPILTSTIVFDDFIFFIKDDLLWCDRSVGESEGHDGDSLAFLDAMGSSAVDDDVAGAGRSFLNVGFEAVAGGDGCDQHLLASPQAYGFHEVCGDLDTAFVFDIGSGDHGSVELRLEDLI